MSSRHTSPAFGAAASTVPHLIDLDTLEPLQDKWIQRYEKSRRPPPAPELNSPRSLRACEQCHVDPSLDLRKLSLLQQLNQVMGTNIDSRIRSITHGDAARSRVAMQAALYAFQRAAIGLGTSNEKLVAYDAYEEHEKTRLQCLATAQDARRRLMAQEKVAATGPRDGRRPPQQRQPQSPSHGAVTGQSSSRQTTPRQERASWPPSNAAGRPLKTPPAPPLVPSHADQPSSAVHDSSRLPDPPGLTGTAAHTHTSRTRASPSSRKAVSPLAPFTPRNAEALNASVFGNRTVSDTTCNPSGVYLSSSKDSQERNRTREHGSSVKPDTLDAISRVGAPRNRTPTHKLLFPVSPREEDSVISLDSAHMDWALGVPTPIQTRRDQKERASPDAKAKALAPPLSIPPVETHETSPNMQSRRSSSARAASVSPITHLEQEQGIFYYCANARPLFLSAS